MARPNRICKTCGSAYSYCPNCSADSNKPRWMNMFDCNDCRIIFDVATRFNLKKTTKEDAQKELSNINLNKNFTEQIKKDLENIFYVEPTPIIVDYVEINKKKSKSKVKKEQLGFCESNPVPIIETNNDKSVLTDLDMN